MPKALSLDLRTRVLAAVAAGASHRGVAERFGVSAASVSRWRTLSRHQGDLRPGPLGGDRRSARIEAYAEAILDLVETTPDLTIQELRLELCGMGLTFGYGTIQRFLIRHDMTRKKRLGMLPGKTVPMSWANVRPGSTPNLTSIRRV